MKVRLFLPDLRSSLRISTLLASRLTPGDTLCFFGSVPLSRHDQFNPSSNPLIMFAWLEIFRPVGVGKSEMIRKLIRTRLKQPRLLVPSPTFSLKHTYDDPNGLKYAYDCVCFHSFVLMNEALTFWETDCIIWICIASQASKIAMLWNLMQLFDQVCSHGSYPHMLRCHHSHCFPCNRSKQMFLSSSGRSVSSVICRLIDSISRSMITARCNSNNAYNLSDYLRRLMRLLLWLLWMMMLCCHLKCLMILIREWNSCQMQDYWHCIRLGTMQFCWSTSSTLTCNDTEYFRHQKHIQVLQLFVCADFAGRDGPIVWGNCFTAKLCSQWHCWLLIFVNDTKCSIELIISTPFYSFHVHTS